MHILSYGDLSLPYGHPSMETMMAGRRKCNDCDDVDECDDCPNFGWHCGCDEDDCDCHCEYDD